MIFGYRLTTGSKVDILGLASAQQQRYQVKDKEPMRSWTVDIGDVLLSPQDLDLEA